MTNIRKRNILQDNVYSARLKKKRISQHKYMERQPFLRPPPPKLAYDRQPTLQKKVLTYSWKTEEQPVAWWQKLAKTKTRYVLDFQN